MTAQEPQDEIRLTAQRIAVYYCKNSKKCPHIGLMCGTCCWMMMKIEDAMLKAVAKEREAAAQVADGHQCQDKDGNPMHYGIDCDIAIAAAIRRREAGG